MSSCLLIYERVSVESENWVDSECWFFLSLLLMWHSDPLLGLHLHTWPMKRLNPFLPAPNILRMCFSCPGWLSALSCTNKLQGISSPFNKLWRERSGRWQKAYQKWMKSPDSKDSAKQGIYFKTQSFLASESQGSDLITDGLHQRENRSSIPGSGHRADYPALGRGWVFWTSPIPFLFRRVLSLWCAEL